MPTPKLETNDQPLIADKYKIFIHPSIHDKETYKLELFHKIIFILFGETKSILADNIRLSDICIINQEDPKENYPGHVRLINQDFLIDCLFNAKMMDLNNIKYFPRK